MKWYKLWGKLKSPFVFFRERHWTSPSYRWNKPTDNSRHSGFHHNTCYMKLKIRAAQKNDARTEGWKVEGEEDVERRIYLPWFSTDVILGDSVHFLCRIDVTRRRRGKEEEEKETSIKEEEEKKSFQRTVSSVLRKCPFPTNCVKRSITVYWRQRRLTDKLFPIFMFF